MPFLININNNIRQISKKKERKNNKYRYVYRRWTRHRIMIFFFHTAIVIVNIQAYKSDTQVCYISQSKHCCRIINEMHANGLQQI